MNMFKKNGGFTLVELIVVIAILAILAAVAIPAYSGYISKAQEANDMTLLDSVKTAVTFAVMEKDATATITKIVVKVSGNTYTVEATVGDNVYSNAAGTADDYKIDISTYVPNSITFKSGNNTATMENGKWTLTKVTAPAAGN